IRRQDRSQLYMIIGALALIGAFIGLFIYLRSSSSAPAPAAPANQAIVQQVTGVNQTTWQKIGTGGLNNPFKSPTGQVINGQPLLKGPNGHPEVFYLGGEFCPFCAAQRWGMLNALSRFGSFSDLKQIQSLEANISTFSFYKSSYSSQYV